MAEKIAAWAQDILTRIFNVHWEGGLAVEFGDKDQDAPAAPAAPEPPTA
jgi:hypothetical protein